MNLDRYTEEQKKMILHKDGPLMVTAGAGSGKTASATARIQYLIETYGIHPSKILVITFTNKAGEEIRGRIAKALNMDKKSINVFTFHGLCHYWLRQKGDVIGINKNYQIMDTSEEETALKTVCRSTIFRLDFYNLYKLKVQRDGNAEHTTEEDIRSLYLESENKESLATKLKISQDLKRKLAKDIVTPLDKVIESYGNRRALAAKAAEVLESYTLYKRNRNLMDFDDLLIFGIKLLRVLPLEYEYITCDESQDSSPVDCELLKAICKNTNNIVMVGDARQAIFGFRGAMSNSMETLVETFNMQQHYLTHNFRCGKKIVEVANETVRRLGLPDTYAARNHEGTVEYFEFNNEYDEISFILNRVKQICQIS